MREKIKNFLVFAIVLILIRGSIAAVLYSEPVRYASNNGSISFNRLTGTITKYDQWDASFPSIAEIIPEKIGGVKVTTIGKEAFSKSYVGDITIPDTVKSIAQNAFYTCPANIYFCGSQAQWERVRKGNADFSNTVIHYDTIMYPVNDGNIVFDPQTGTIIGCDDDTTAVDIPTSINGIPVVAIGENAFFDCDNLTHVTIPDSVTTIGACAFSDCKKLSDISIPDSVTILGHGAFSGCESLTSITIPGSVRIIGDYAFSPETRYYDTSSNDFYSKFNLKDRSSLISNLTNVTILDGVITIGYRAFSLCSSLTSIIIPDSVTTIGDSAFSHCNSLTNITIPDSVTTINDYAFSDCNSLTSITIPDSVTSIGRCTFYGCSSLTSITIPDSVATIGSKAFSCCSLTDIYYSGSETEWEQIEKRTNDFNGAVIHYGAEA